ncbi:unnamed protein product, partial [Acanthoscelides obtectus]
MKVEDSWLKGLMSRNPDLSFRTTELTSIARCCGLNRRQVDIFYDNLWNVFENHILLQRQDD